MAEQDWSVSAGTLEWTCWQTVDHMIDCVFSYAMQVAARAPSGFLPFGELHANADASNRDLAFGLPGGGEALPPEARQTRATLSDPGQVSADVVVAGLAPGATLIDFNPAADALRMIADIRQNRRSSSDPWRRRRSTLLGESCPEVGTEEVAG